MKRVTVFTICLATVACSSQPAAPENPIRVTDAAGAAGCRMVGDVYGTSSFYGVFIDKGIAKARAEAFVQARKLGANAVVWGPLGSPYGSTTVNGNAYACP